MPNGNMLDGKGNDFDRLSTDELLSILHADLNSDPQERLSPESIKRIVKTLRKRDEESGKYKSVDVAAAWERFQAENVFLPEKNDIAGSSSKDLEKETPNKYRSNLGDARLPRRHPVILRKLITVAAVISLLFVTMLVAQAVGIDVFGAIGRWTDETFQFVLLPKEGPALQEDGNMSSVSENHALLQTALNDCGITETLAPSWFPEGFSLFEHKIINNDSGNTVSFFFKDTKQEYFTIQIIKVSSASDIETYLFEKDDSAVKQYVSQGKTFYLLSNLDNQTATWSDGNSLVMIILGNISENDIKAMIDSIGGV